MRKAFYFTFALACLLAFGLVSCDMGLTPQETPTGTTPTNPVPPGDTSPDKLLEVKDKVNGATLVITITRSKPTVSKSAARSVASGSYYYKINLGGTTISYGTVVVAASDGTIAFFPDENSLGGETPFTGTLTVNDVITIQWMPVGCGFISDVVAGANGGEGKAHASFDAANVEEFLDPTWEEYPPIILPENPVTPGVPVATQKTLTITGIPAQFDGKYLYFQAGNDTSVVFGYVPDTEMNSEGVYDLLFAQIKNKKADLKLYYPGDTEGKSKPYTDKGTFDYFLFDIVDEDEGYFYFNMRVTFSDANTTLAWPVQRTVTINNIPDEFWGKYMFFSASNSKDNTYIFGYEAYNDDYILSQINSGTVVLKMYDYRDPYMGNGKFDELNITIYGVNELYTNTIAHLKRGENIDFNAADVKLDAGDWPFIKEAITEKVTVEINQAPTKTMYTVGQEFDPTGLEFKIPSKDKTFLSTDPRVKIYYCFDPRYVDEGSYTYTFLKEGTITVTVSYFCYSDVEGDQAINLFLDPDKPGPSFTVTVSSDTSN